MEDEIRVDAPDAAEARPNVPVNDEERPAPARLAHDADRPDQLPLAVAVGVMVLLLICATLVLVAWNRAPV